MSWRGRNRDSGERYPSGKLRPKTKPKPPPAQPHREGFGDDPKAATCHGRYRLRNLISEPQWAAGEWFGRHRAMYRAAIGSPDTFRTHDDAHPWELDMDPRDDAEVIRRFEAIRKALGRLYVDVEWIVCTDAMLVDLRGYRAGLDKLVVIYGIK